MDDIAQLQAKMDAAAAALDYEEARRLRDRIARLRGGGTLEDAPVDTSGLQRQQPGAMGLGTSQQKVTPPPGWKPPPKPDLMTRNHSKRR